jgi:Holliday junction resolvase RusA-like endonuclease
MNLKFTVPGPPVPKARARTVLTSAPGAPFKFRSFTPQRTEKYEAHVKMCALVARSKIRGFKWPLEHEAGYKVNLNVYRNHKRGDFDNFFKAACDAMQGIIYCNDNMIRAASGEMFDGDPKPRIEVEVTLL